MAHGVCLNENCEKDKWWLTKHPDDYANGVKCPDCGTSRTEIDWGGPQESNGGQQEPQRQEPQQPQRQPQQREQQAQQPRGQAPARREPQRAAPTTVEQPNGGQAGDLVAAADSDLPPEQRVEAAQRAGGWAGRALGSLIEYASAKKSRQSKNAEGARLEQVQNKPRCMTENCNHVFKEIRDHDDEVQCPECGAVYNVLSE